MTVELQDLIGAIAVHAAAVVDSALSSLFALSAAEAPNGVDPVPLVVGGGAGGVVGGGSVVGGGGGGRGFRYAGNDGTVYDRPGGTAVGDAPAGGRLVYDSVTRDSNGTPTHYHVNVPGSGRSGWIPAGNTSNTRPTVPPPPRPSVVIEGGAGLANSSSAQTAGSRG